NHEFSEHGFKQSRIEARFIAEHILKCDYSRILAGLAPNPTPEQSLIALKILNARLAGKPLAHILGYTDFYGLRFKVTPGVLVPRPETEILVETALKILQTKNTNSTWILDLYTGCGNILLSIISNMPQIHGAGIDIDPVSISYAETNRESLKIRNAVFTLGRVSDILGKLDNRFNLITANPPYIPSAEIDTLESEVKNAENRDALDGGEDGLDEIRIISELAKNALTDDGVLLCEIGAGQSDSVRDLFSHWSLVLFGKDYLNHDRILVAHV
ncbi:MAG TPA: peptide chain release factor N(5)-glutamine methyltransferase, partial [Firmicutes bacterium]|nr:peptide chain release factor N(5)-glutamine methyltransferase [Bacillota bacterium]